MELGISSASFYPHTNTEDTIEIMKSMDFNMGEIFLNSPFEYDDSFIDKLVEIKDEKEFIVNSVHSFCGAFEPYIFDKYKRRRNDMLKYFKDVCRAGKKLGAKSYTFHGMRLMDLNSLDLNSVIDTYNELTYISNESGIKLAQENVFWCMSSNLDYLKILREKVKYPLYYTFDIKQAYKAGIESEKYIEIMDKNLVNLHLNDRDEKNVCLLPGRGTVDFAAIKQLLDKIDYQGIGTIEVYSDNYKSFYELSESKKLLDKIFNVNNKV